MQEEMRQPVELAITCGRSWQSPQTGYIHYCYHILDEPNHDTIPIVENFLFTLALLRSRTAENIQEAKVLIGKLLCFQNFQDLLSQGNFPVYLHDYPVCRDRYLGAQLLPIFYWIIKYFHTILGSELLQRFEVAIKALLKQTVRSAIDKAPPYPIAIRVAASAIVIGTLYNEDYCLGEGKEAMEKIQKKSLEEKRLLWASPLHLADTLVALQMLYPCISKSPWADFWHYLNQTWHRTAHSYVGIPLKEWQVQREPQCTLYDFFMGYFSKSYSYRIFSSHPIQLHAALIHPTEDSFFPLEFPANYHYAVGSHRHCDVIQCAKHGYTLLQHPMPSNEKDKGLHHFRLAWGDSNNTHTFVCQGKDNSKINYKIVPGGADMFFHLSVENNEEEQDIAFYVDHHEGLEIKVGNNTATTFQLGEKLIIVDESITVTLTFELIEGEGQFFGHVMRGNRPSQLGLRRENRFQSFDWRLFLRAVRCPKECVLRCEIRIG